MAKAVAWATAVFVCGCWIINNYAAATGSA